jgi:hypothetical protein
MTENVASAGCADINRQIVVCHIDSPGLFCTEHLRYAYSSNTVAVFSGRNKIITGTLFADQEG